MKKILTFTLGVTAAVFVLSSTAFAGPGGREADARIQPRQHAETMTYVGPARTGTTIGLAVTTEEERSELRLEQRFNSRGQAFFLYVPRWMEASR